MAEPEQRFQERLSRCGNPCRSSITYFFACVTVNVEPAIVSVPVRAPPVFAATVNVTVPVPVRVAPLVIVIQLTLLAAVHAQPDCVVTVTGPPVPPSVGNAWLVGLMVYVHPEFCEIVTVFPATVSVPLRAGPVFADTV